MESALGQIRQAAASGNAYIGGDLSMFGIDMEDLQSRYVFNQLVNSKVFLALVDQGYLTDERSLQRVKWARMLSKPCVLMIDLDVSEDQVDQCFQGANVIRKIRHDFKNSDEASIKKLVDENLKDLSK